MQISGADWYVIHLRLWLTCHFLFLFPVFVCALTDVFERLSIATPHQKSWRFPDVIVSTNMYLFFSSPFHFCLNHIWWIFGNFHETYYFWQIPHHKVWLFRLWNWALIFQKTKMQYLTKRTSSRSRWVWNIHQLIFYCQNISFPFVRYVMEHTSYRRQGCKGLKTCNKLQKGIVLQKLRLFFQLHCWSQIWDTFSHLRK